jgi:hypothetical protein
MNELNWLTNWYLSQCDGDWEHQYGIQMGTLDNPGWTVAIDLADTTLEAREFAAIENMATDDSWWFCRVENRRWRAACGPKDLEAVIGLFRNWADTK